MTKRTYRTWTDVLYLTMVSTRLNHLTNVHTTLSRKVVNGREWIRTTESIASRFTVCPRWPLEYSPVESLDIVWDGMHTLRPIQTHSRVLSMMQLYRGFCYPKRSWQDSNLHLRLRCTSHNNLDDFRLLYDMTISIYELDRDTNLVAERRQQTYSSSYIFVYTALKS